MTSCMLLGGCGGDSGSGADGFIQVGNPPAPIGVGVSQPAPAEKPAPAAAKPVAKPAAKPVAQSTAQPAVQPAAPAVAKPTAKPTAKPSTQPTAEPATKPASQAAAQPTTQPAAEAKTKAPAAAPVTPKASAPTAKSAEKAPAKPKTTEPAQAAAKAAPKSHKVASGDTLYGISKQYGLTVGQMLVANPGTSANSLAPGQTLTIPSPSAAGAATTAPKRSHTIASGDTLSAIAKRYRVDSQAILSANTGLDPRRLRPGTKIVIPATKTR